MECSYETGDLVQTLVDLIIRKDGLTYGEADTDDDGKIPKDWATGADMLPAGTLCSFLRQAEDDKDYALVCRDMMGKTIFVRLSVLQLVSSFKDSVEVESETNEI